MQVGPLGWENPLEKKMAAHSLACEIPRTEEPGRLQSMGLQTVSHKLVTKQPPPKRHRIVLETIQGAEE